PAMDSLMNSNGRRMMLMLQLTVAMVILIACANVANMLLARATTRSRALAVRTAMGAGRGRLIRQLLTEGLVLSLAAAGLGLALAYGLNEALVYISAGAEEAFLMAEIDGRVLAFTVGVALVAPVAFGLFPALKASSTGPASALRGGRAASDGASGGRARGILVTTQVSLALCLMIVAGLLTRSVVKLNDSSLGYDLEGLLTVRVDLPDNRYRDEGAPVRFFQEASEELAALPDVDAVTLVSALPGIDPASRRAVEIEGVQPVEGRSAPAVGFIAAGPELFDVLGLPLVSGRALTDSDDGAGVPVAVVSRYVADRFWSGDPLGRRFRPAGTEGWIQVVGVVEDVGRGREIDDRGAAANVYVPYAQDGRAGMYLVAAAPSATVEGGPVRQALWQVDPDLPIGAVRTMERAEYERSGANYAIITLFGVFAVAALLMAVVGIYGVMAYSVSQRRKEIGVRLALGAERSGVRRLILTQGSKLVVGGLVIGLGLSLLLSRILESMVFGISATDPATFLGVSALLVVVAVIATLIPASRAVRTDPATTLREG
ncbi:MAG: FtsX-like permease family protein, partial [Longimicrobiales bacterium]|nr:FtsX-like permease family protein [Longimicrobiales bacterium]